MIDKNYTNKNGNYIVEKIYKNSKNEFSKVNKPNLEIITKAFNQNLEERYLRLEEAVKVLKTKYDAELAALGTATKANVKNKYTISISDIENELTGINDPVSFTKYKSQLNLRLQEKKIDPANVTAILELLKNKESILLNTNDVKVSETLLKVGDKLIVKNTIFKSVNSSFESALTGEPEVFATEGVELTISSIKNNKVMFKYQGSQKTINMSEINNYFTTLDIVEFNEKNVVGVDNTSIATAVDSSTITEQFLSTANAKELEDEYKNISAEDALDNLESERDENCKK